MINLEVIIPKWENSYKFSEKTKIKYWEFKNKLKMPKKYLEVCRDEPLLIGAKAYCADDSGERFIKNPLKAGNPNLWVLNGQGLYSATLNWRQRKGIAIYYHNYFSKYIREQLQPLEIPQNSYLSVSCDIYEVERGNMPDVSNMWPLEKFFEDALIECGIIPDDGPNYVRESGRKRYYFVDSIEERKLVFKIKALEND